MELRQLAYFVAVAEEQSFTRAAARLHVTQPGVSAQVRQLEAACGAPLFDRVGRTVRLTAVGNAVLPHARAALAAADAVRSVAAECAGVLRGRITIGMLIACASLELAETLAAFHREHPSVEISVVEANSDVLVRDVLFGELDMAYVGLAGETPAGLALWVVADEPLVAAVALDAYPALGPAVPITALEDLPLISLPQGTGLRACLDRGAAAASARLHIVCEASDLQTVARFAERGLGVALLPASLAQAHDATLRTIAISESGMRSRIGLAWRADGPTNPAARALVSHARACMGRATNGGQAAATGIPRP